MRENNPTLMIDIEDVMLYYFIHKLFKQTSKGLVVSTWSAAGAVLCSLIETSNFKHKYKSNENTISLVIPLSEMNRNLAGRFIYLSPENLAKFITVLRREFHLIFITYVYEGSLAGLSKKECVERFIEEYKLSAIPTAFETLTKRRQRVTQYSIRDFNLKLRQMAYDASKKARKTHTNIK